MLLLVLSAFCFAAGGLCMKLSQGATRPAPTAGFLILFVAGALLQALAMRAADMGAVYVAVLGLEAVLAFAISALVLREAVSWPRVTAVALILAGVALLRR